jgi:hypothetical protein
VSVPLTGLALSGSGATYTLDLSSVTATAGAYELKLTAAASGIVDSAGNVLAVDASDAWVFAERSQYDVNDDGTVNVIDILEIVNWMTLFGSNPTSPSTSNYDTTLDDYINMLDILAIVNHLTESWAAGASTESGGGEGEGPATDAFATGDAEPRGDRGRVALDYASSVRRNDSDTTSSNPNRDDLLTLLAIDVATASRRRRLSQHMDDIYSALAFRR